MRVFVSYAHDEAGRRMHDFVVGELVAAGFEPVSDSELPEVNPTSLQVWMQSNASMGPVIAVLSPAYLANFAAERSAESRLGVTFEGEILLQRIYEHREAHGCPVIPVAPVGVDLDGAPAPLRRLLITVIDQRSGAGLDELRRRLTALLSSPPVTIQAPHPADPTAYVRRLREQFENGELGPHDAVAAITGLLKFVDSVSAGHGVPIAEIFVAAEHRLKDSGDLLTIDSLAQRCITDLTSRKPRLRDDRALEARIRICGTGWVAQRQDRLAVAALETELGIDLAREVHDRRTLAFGLKCGGRIARLRAESGVGDRSDQRAHLRASVRQLSEAAQEFEALDGHGSPDRAECHSLMARTFLSAFALGIRTDYPTEIDDHLRLAEEGLPPGRSKARLDFELLRVEASFARPGRHHHARLVHQLDRLVEKLADTSGVVESEILGRTLFLRARVEAARVGQRPTGLQLERCLADLARSASTFRLLGQQRSSAECEWQAVVLSCLSPGGIQYTRSNINALLDASADAGERMEALRQVDGDIADRQDVLVGQRRQSVDWQKVLRAVRQRRQHPGH